MAASQLGQRLSGKVAIVTGGGSGYGAGIARRFAREGAKVVIADINEDGMKNVAASDVGTNGGELSYCTANVTSEQDWRKLADTTKSRYGRIDILINNAGTTYNNKDTAKVTEADFDKCFNVNVKGVFFGTQVIIPILLEQGGGSIVNVASVGATRPRPGLVWCDNASKGAVWNVTKGLAAEYGPQGVRINSVCPLLGGTGLFEAFSGQPDTAENRKKFIDNVPLRRLCEPEDVANTCLYLASDEANFITGVNLEVDGGRAV